MRSLLASLVFLCAAAPASAGFSSQQIDFLTSPQDGAELHAQYFYHYFNPERPAKLVPPPWVDKILPAMLKHPVWRDPEEGVLDEAKLWQAPASVLYEFYQHTRKTFPVEKGGASASPSSLLRDYEDSRSRFQMTLDRLYRARLGDSLEGRGRSVMAAFDLILQEMNSLLNALVNQDGQGYADSVMAIGALTNQAYRVLQEPPRGPIPGRAEEGPGAAGAVGLVLLVVGTFFMFAAAWSLAAANQDKIDKAVEDFWVRSRQWAREFNRQFVQIKVQYLVVVPALLGIIVGIATLNVFGFILLSAAGAYIGYNAPRWLLDFIRHRRGKRVEAQLMDAMVLLSNALKSGLDILQGFELVSRDLVPPISEEFGLVIKNYQLGTTFEKALEGMEARIESRLLSYVIRAIVIQRTAGGNLTKIFDRIVENIRDEGKLEEKTQALTAQQKIQAVVVGIMPWVMVAVMFVFQPDVMTRYYFSLLGVLTIGFCVFWMSIGIGLVRKLAVIEV